MQKTANEPSVMLTTVEKKPDRRAWTRLRKNKAAHASLWFLILIHVVVFIGPFVWTMSPEATNPANTLASWSVSHPFGTDDLGRDVFSRMLHGGRITLLVGAGAMVFTVLIGGIVGACAGFFGKWIEAILMRFTEAMMSIPNFFFALVALTVLGKTPWMVVLVIALCSWMEIARVVYGETLKWKQQEFVEASIALGAKPLWTLVKHVIPQIIPSIIVASTLGIAWAILTESAISYLGLGIQPPTATWGNMLQDAQAYIWTAPILGVLPGIAITVVVLAYNFLGDGLRDALDPRHIQK
ncbi:ABC transporter permease [Aureibacillus halotolerans]|uniref:Peptide/nickel transport system permease protein n=1 Tax=Aureibacillus halotolerans TaxID=1508390 RepID=A0A4R6TZJ1_9BACI|nr:ABC transporter permease [Aureibacillus halotolerans]TDQ38302.1 peptide/nickel transport system permease protein [Aureibacillus halotolerans]